MRNIQNNSNFISLRFIRDMGYCPRHSRAVMLTSVPTHYRCNKKSGPCLERVSPTSGAILFGVSLDQYNILYQSRGENIRNALYSPPIIVLIVWRTFTLGIQHIHKNDMVTGYLTDPTALVAWLLSFPSSFTSAPVPVVLQPSFQTDVRRKLVTSFCPP